MRHLNLNESQRVSGAAACIDFDTWQGMQAEARKEGVVAGGLSTLAVTLVAASYLSPIYVAAAAVTTFGAVYNYVKDNASVYAPYR